MLLHGRGLMGYKVHGNDARRAKKVQTINAALKIFQHKLMKRPEGNHSVVHRDGSILPQVLRQVISAELRLCLELCDVELDTPGLHTRRHEIKGAGKMPRASSSLTASAVSPVGLGFSRPQKASKWTAFLTSYRLSPGIIKILLNSSSPMEEPSWATRFALELLEP